MMHVRAWFDNCTGHLRLVADQTDGEDRQRDVSIDADQDDQDFTAWTRNCRCCSWENNLDLVYRKK